MTRGLDHPFYRFTAVNPEWWAWLVCGFSWLWLFTSQEGSLLTLRGCPFCLNSGDPGTPLSIWYEGIADWLIMVLAMMIPMVIIPMRTTAVRSLWHRRHRAIAGFLLGYIGAWLFAGLFAVPLLILVGRFHLGWAAIGTGAFLVATLWQISPWKKRAKFSCHRTIPLAPTGWNADRDCLRYGLIHGRSCLTSCWALMLAPMLVLHNPITMMAAGLVCAYERYWAQIYDRTIARGLVLITIGMLLALLVTWSGPSFR